MKNTLIAVRSLFIVTACGALLASCASTQPPCNGPQSRNLDKAISEVQSNLTSGCAAHFDRYFDDLLTIAEGDPKASNKRAFSEFLSGPRTKGW